MRITQFSALVMLVSCITLAAQSNGVSPNDPRYSAQWYLHQIAAPSAWQATTGNSNVVVAIIDTGVDYLHPDLARNMWHNPGEVGLDPNGNDKATNGLDDDNNGYIDDVHGIDAVNGTGDPMDTGAFESPQPPFYHGTLLAGLIGAEGNDRVGISGLNWSLQIMAIRAFGGDRSAADYYPRANSGILAAWDYVIKMKRRGINVRVTCNTYGVRFDLPAVRDMIATAAAEGILSIFAAGNFPVDQDLFSYFPGAFNLPSSINVAATTETGSLWEFSCFGRSTVDLAAPGFNMISTWKGGGYLEDFTGTSAAAPLVAGAAALLLSADPKLNPDQLKAAILGSVDQPASLRGKLVTHGRLNVARALEYVRDTNHSAIIINASPVGQRNSTNAPIELTFSQPMNRVTVESAFILNPPITGVFRWSDDSRSLRFDHENPFDARTNYTARLLASALDAFGRVIDGNFNRAPDGSPADDFVWTFRFPVHNDDFANAEPLVALSGAVTGDNRSAYGEVGEPAHVLNDYRFFGGSVWYSWTAPLQADWMTFDLRSPSFDSLLAVYIGDRVDALTPVVGADDFGARQSGRVTFSAHPGQSYKIAVSSKDAYDPAKAGSFNLSWYPTPAPGFTGSQFTPLSAAPGAKINLTGTNFTGTSAVLFNGASASFTNAPTNNLDLRITAIVPPDATSGPITIRTPHGDVTSTSTFTVLHPELSFTRSASNELLLAWSDRSLLLESSPDLLAWTAASAVGSTNFFTTLTAPRAFFRLRKPLTLPLPPR